LNYICDNNYHRLYDYAIHCDLDDRFWSIDYESIATTFQYDVTKWDAMTCVNKYKTYYDFWALRCDKSWFNINIFSCDAQSIDYNTKTKEFEKLLKNANGPIETTSSFNGMGIYKLKSIIPCRYNAAYYCSICNGENIGCKEDNDHIGLHKQMIHNKCKVFINHKMYIQSAPINSIPYEKFIDSIRQIKYVEKDSLSYLLTNHLIDKNGKWIMSTIDNEYIVNIFTSYNHNTLYAFSDSTTPKKYSLLNKNVQLIESSHDKPIVDIIFTDLTDPNEYISFIYFDTKSYQDVKNILHMFRNKIKNGCIILFKNLINYKKYYLNALKAFYEFIQEYEILHEWYIMNGALHLDTNGLHKDSEKDIPQYISVKIINNPLFNIISKEINFDSPEYVNFDWIFYTSHYKDLSTITHKEDAFDHWINYGKYEGRTCTTIVTSQTVLSDLDDPTSCMNSFDWEVYLELNRDLKAVGISTKEEAYLHWIQHGIKEGRLDKFDWCTYVKNYNLLSKSIDTKIKAINHWLDNGTPEINIENINYTDQLFDWKFYVDAHADLSHISSPQLAWNHWLAYGKKEGRKCHHFNWTNYLLLNSDLIQIGIDNEFLATEHWIKHGRKENRKYLIK